MNLRVTGVSVTILFCIFCHYRSYRRTERLSRDFYAGGAPQELGMAPARAACRRSLPPCGEARPLAIMESETILEELRDGVFGPGREDGPKILVRLLRLHDADGARC